MGKATNNRKVQNFGCVLLYFANKIWYGNSTQKVHLDRADVSLRCATNGCRNYLTRFYQEYYFQRAGTKWFRKFNTNTLLLGVHHLCVSVCVFACSCHRIFRSQLCGWDWCPTLRKSIGISRWRHAIYICFRFKCSHIQSVVPPHRCTRTHTPSPTLCLSLLRLVASIGSTTNAKYTRPYIDDPTLENVFSVNCILFY